MTIIDRYILKQVLVACGFAVLVLSLVLVLGNIFQRMLDLLVNHSVPVEYILSFIAYVIPFSLTFTIPWGFLTALLLVFGRLSADAELLSLRACGVAIPRLCLPVFILAAVFSAICLYINLEVAPRAQDNMRNTLIAIATSNPIAMFSSDTVIEEFPNRKIYVGNREGNELQNVHVYEVDEAGNPIEVVYAETGTLEMNLENQEVLMRLFDMRFERSDPDDATNPRKIRHGIIMEEGVWPISLKELHARQQRGRGLSSLTLAELAREMAAGEISSPSEARTEMSKRFSFSFACIAFALIAIPLAVTAHRRETSTGFGLSILVAFTYFLFIIIADTFRHNPDAHPEFLMWLPNLIFIGLGAFLFYRLSRK